VRADGSGSPSAFGGGPVMDSLMLGVSGPFRTSHSPRSLHDRTGRENRNRFYELQDDLRRPAGKGERASQRPRP
jgi:hypothetical protein